MDAIPLSGELPSDPYTLATFTGWTLFCNTAQLIHKHSFKSPERFWPSSATLIFFFNITNCKFFSTS